MVKTDKQRHFAKYLFITQLPRTEYILTDGFHEHVNKQYKHKTKSSMQEKEPSRKT